MKVNDTAMSLPPPLHPLPAILKSGGQSKWPWAASEDWAGFDNANTKGRELPKVTVITPSYNQGEYLEQTIRSILLQGYPNLEYIVVDGGSNDESNTILDRYAPWINHLIREPDNGQSDAICKGLKLATGDIFNWINSDDTLQPGVLWELANHFHSTSDLYTFPVSVQGDDIETYLMRNQNLSARSILRDDRYSFSQPGVWFRMKELKECGGIDLSLNYGFDWDLIIRYLAKFPRVQYSTTTGAMFRIHDQSKTVVENTKADAEANRFKQETDRIRDKLETQLARPLANASRLGRRRVPWHQTLIATLDDLNQSPTRASLQILHEAWRDPAARFSRRTVGSIARLMSRYVRPGFRNRTQ
ncbi:Glycosyl transferase family 2 [Neorhodopirellula lusitana]|uniref:Glycosyl transferase family 2 n=2 Tax=Neorhodopirellula lusitana TaxID=445327 RepID=A0ABY1Q125_9BACT|nr:Glycosyl transferase family 2 [Neorhodopirellula lusitana]